MTKIDNLAHTYQEFLEKFPIMDCQVDHELHIPRRTLRAWRAQKKIPRAYMMGLLDYFYSTGGNKSGFESVKTYAEFMEKFPKVKPRFDLGIPKNTVSSWRNFHKEPVGYLLYLIDYFYSTGGHIDA